MNIWMALMCPREKLTPLMLMYLMHQAACLRILVSYFSICSIG
jgi:hypothetical protein